VRFGRASIGLAAALAFASSAASAGDGWVRVSPPGAIGPTSCPRVSGPGVLLSTRMGMTRSLDGGRTWTDASAGLTRSTWDGRPEQIVAAAATDTSLLAVASSGAVYRSADQGASWTLVAPPVANWAVSAMSTARLAVGPGHVHLSLSGHHWDSVDDGRTWTENPNHFLLSPFAVLAREGRLIAGAEHGVLGVSTDDGAHWQRPRRGLPRTLSTFTALAEDGGHLYAATASDGLFLSRDGGDSWRAIRLDDGGKTPAIGELLFVGTTLYVTSDQGIFRSARRGPWPRVHGPMLCPLLASGDVLISGAGDHDVQSVDQGVTWTPLGAGYGNDEVSAIAVSGSVVVLRNFYPGPAFVSSDGGRSFASPPAARIVGAAVGGSMILLGATEVFGRQGDDGPGFLLRSTDAGRTWTRLPIPAGATTSRSYPLIVDGKTVLIAADGLALSSDAGETWTRIIDGFPAPYRGWLYTGSAQFAVVSGPNFVLGGEDGLFVRPRAGGPWEKTSPPGVHFPAPQGVTAVVRGDAVYAAVAGRLYRSDDDGRIWIDLTAGIPLGSKTPLVDLVAARGRDVLIATKDAKRTLFSSRDRGASWRRLDEGLPPNRVTALTATDTGLLAGTMGAGLWRHE
jgi:photosystem II stability/assembly factor-like uncharacterized protein